MAHEKLLTILNMPRLKTKKKKVKIRIKNLKNMLFTKIKTYLEFNLQEFIFKPNNIFGFFNFFFR